MINKKQFIDYLLKICKGKEIVYDNVGKDMIKLPNKIIFDKNISINLFILKKGVFIILLQNLNPVKGLYNSIRLIIRKFNNHVIDAEILTDSHFGKKMFISQINIIPSNFSIYYIYQ